MTDTRSTTEGERHPAPEPTREPTMTPENRGGTEAIANAADAPAPARRDSEPNDGSMRLFDAEATNRLRNRWDNAQTGFVDDPQSAVKTADELVTDVMKQLADGFAKERRQLEEQWSRGDDVSTEDLRIALQRYRSFFDRLLAA